MPIPLIRNLPQHQLSRAKRIHKLQTHGRDHGTHKTMPHDLVGEVIRDLFEGEEDAADGGAEGDGHACCAGGGEDFAFFGWWGQWGT